MLRNYLLIAYSLIKAFFMYAFRIAGVDRRLYYSSLYLFSKASFRLPESAKSDAFIILKTYFHVIRHIASESGVHVMLSEHGASAVLDTDLSAKEKRIRYLKFFNVEPDIFISKVHLLGTEGLLSKLIHFILVTFSMILILPFSFSSLRANYALLLREIPELVNLLDILKMYNIKRLFEFCIYEKDSNFNAYILSRKGIMVTKITSEVPLVFANKIILADEINLCFRYQVEEIKVFRKSLFYRHINMWLPEMQIEYIDRYQRRHFRIPTFKLGFYSSAFWLRKKLNHSVADIGSYDAENELLLSIKEYMESNTFIELILFTHPYEKRTDEQFAESVNYYRNLFEHSLMNRIRITGKETISTNVFHSVNIGISLFSTIIFERLSLGFKSILAPFDKGDFPLDKSPFRNICAHDKKELFEKIEKNLGLSKDNFFERNMVSQYISEYAEVQYELT
jgi:hypothetical protein